MWLSSCGKLSKENQQFGPWMRANSEKSQQKSVVSISGFGKASDGKPSAEATRTGRASIADEVPGCKVQDLQVACYANLEPDKFNEKLQEIDKEWSLVDKRGSTLKAISDVPSKANFSKNLVENSGMPTEGKDKSVVGKLSHDIGPSEAQLENEAFMFTSEKPKLALQEITNSVAPSKAQSKKSLVSWKKLARKAKAQTQDVIMFETPRTQPSIEESKTPKQKRRCSTNHGPASPNSSLVVSA